MHDMAIKTSDVSSNPVSSSLSYSFLFTEISLPFLFAHEEWAFHEEWIFMCEIEQY